MLLVCGAYDWSVLFVTVPPQSLPQLMRELHSLLVLVSEDRPLALVLDGLDELSEEHEADLSWLYTPLLPHVYTILSASTRSSSARLLQVHLLRLWNIEWKVC